MNTISDTLPSSLSNTGAAASDRPLAIHGIRVAQALARFAGDEQRYRHWLIEFIGYGPAVASQIRQAITDGSPDVAVNLTHALKVRTGMLGMPELHSIALSLEMSLRNKEPPDIWLDELERTVAEMSGEISTVLAKPAA